MITEQAGAERVIMLTQHDIRTVLGIALLLGSTFTWGAELLPVGHPLRQEILALTQDYYQAWSYTRADTDYEQAGRFYSQRPDRVFWDPLPPLEGYRGWAEYRDVVAKVWRPAGLLAASIQLAHDDSFRVWRQQDTVWTIGNCLVYTESASGETATVPCRGTQIWVRENGRWLIAHEHFSAPVQPSAHLLQSRRRADPRLRPDAEFTDLVQRIDRCWNDGPLATADERLQPFYADSAQMSLYMPWPPHDGYRDWSGFQAGIRDYVALTARRLTLRHNDDLEANRRGDLAWTTATVHLHFDAPGGNPMDADGRQTLIWQRSGQKWRVLHEHLSLLAGH